MNIIVSPEIVTVGMFTALLLGVLTGFPLALPIGGVGLITGYLLFGPNAFDLIYSRLYAIITDYGFMAVPLFVFMGNMLEKSGIAEKIKDAVYIWVNSGSHYQYFSKTIMAALCGHYCCLYYCANTCCTSSNDETYIQRSCNRSMIAGDLWEFNTPVYATTRARPDFSR